MARPITSSSSSSTLPSTSTSSSSRRTNANATTTTDNTTSSNSSSRSRSSSSSMSTKQLLTSFLLCALCYYAGSFTATTILHEQILNLQTQLSTLQTKYNTAQNELRDAKQQLDGVAKASLVQTKLEALQEERKEDIPHSHSPRFSDKDNVPFMGMAKTSKKDFVGLFDYGSPVPKLQDSNVLLFYNEKSIPTDLTYEEKENIINSGISNGGDNGNKSKDGTIQMLDAKKATNNCQIVHVATIPTDDQRKQSCLAVVQNYPNQFLQKWMRNNNALSQPFQAVNRGQTEKSRIFRTPESDKIQQHWKILKQYLNTVEDVLEDLKDVAKRVAIDNTIIVLTCNMGQSELLMNFVCNAKAKGLDMGNVLVFPTDAETKDLAEGLGLATFHDDRNFGHLPKGEARHYGDRTFTAMMYAKIICVQLISHLGYDLLFQDVDIIWYKNPLNYFHDKSNPYYNFDMYFQEDGALSTRYAPYSANSGFYYVRNNEKTRYLFTSLLYRYDDVLQVNSHQQTLIQLMADHASLYGLRVKVLSRDMQEFPGGWHYHRRKDFMKDIMKEKVVPEIFHMSWTQNKKNKVKFFQQIGEWFLDSKCIGNTVDVILGVGSKSENGGSSIEGKNVLFEPCCLAEPNIVCHYRDKPSKVPCKDAPPIDKGHPSFW